MNIIFLTLGKIRDGKQTDIYSSLLREFTSRGHDVYVISPAERREKEKPAPGDYGRLHLHFAETGNYFHTGWIEKGITAVFISRRYIKTVKRELGGIRFDLVLYSTPPVTFAGAAGYLKRKHHAVTYLMLKDIWPRSMADMGVLKTSGLQGIIYKYFRLKEIKMYRCSDYIGCMSPACAGYLLRNNRYIRRSRVELCPNAVNLDGGWDRAVLSDAQMQQVRRRYHIPAGKVVFVSGGNIGKGQDPDFLIECMRLNEKRTDTYMLFAGSGIYYDRIKSAVEDGHLKNSNIIPCLPRDEYAELVAACDVGMVVLNYRFTCPNHPSRLLAYLMGRKPVAVACDKVSDAGITAQKNGYGYYCGSNDPEGFVSLMDEFLDAGKRKEMGEKGYEYLKRHYNTKRVYRTIMRHFD